MSLCPLTISLTEPTSCTGIIRGVGAVEGAIWVVVLVIPHFDCPDMLANYSANARIMTVPDSRTRKGYNFYGLQSSGDVIAPGHS